MTTYQVSSQWHIIDNRLSWLMDNDTTQEHRSQLIAGIRKDLKELWERYEGPYKYPETPETTKPLQKQHEKSLQVADFLQAVKGPQQSGFTGNFCADCGGANMIRSGTCEVCIDCGTTTGCS